MICPMAVLGVTVVVMLAHDAIMFGSAGSHLEFQAPNSDEVTTVQSVLHTVVPLTIPSFIQFPVLHTQLSNEEKAIFIDGGLNGHTVAFAFWLSFTYFIISVSLISTFFHIGRHRNGDG